MRTWASGSQRSFSGDPGKDPLAGAFSFCRRIAIERYCFKYLWRFIFFPPLRQMCNTSMSVSTDGAVSTSQIPASEQETLVGILSQGATFKNILLYDVIS